MTKTEHLERVIADNLKRVDGIFSAVDFGKVCMTAELITDMNDFFVVSKNPMEGFEDG